MKLGWYDMGSFNLAEYQLYEKVENGDLNWIIPGKFVAFSTPVDSSRAGEDYSFTPEYYAPIFKKLGITMVVRLNNKEYDSEVLSPPHFSRSLLNEALSTWICSSRMERARPK